MGWGERLEERVREPVRWLAAPHTVLALVVLVLNDHVGKHQWPGTLTGKLSDVAGLVVAPALLAVALSVVTHLRRPDLVALAATAVGFTAVKLTASGADVAGAVWSLVTPSYVVRDASDLLALPAVAVAWWAARWAHRPRPWTRRALVAATAVLLPASVVATAATSACDPHPQVIEVFPVAGRLATTPAGWDEDLILWGFGAYVVHDGHLVVIEDSDGGRSRELVTAAVNGDPALEACSRVDVRRCWRLARPPLVGVEASADSGFTWVPEPFPSRQRLQRSVDDLGTQCGERATLGTGDIGVVDTPQGPVVAVPLQAAGVALRGADGRWTVVPVNRQYTDRPTTPVPSGEPLTLLDPVPPGPGDPEVEVTPASARVSRPGARTGG